MPVKASLCAAAGRRVENAGLRHLLPVTASIHTLVTFTRNRPGPGVRIARVALARSTRRLRLRPRFAAVADHAPRTRRRTSPPRPATAADRVQRQADRPSGGAAAIRCELARSAVAVNRRRRSAAAAAEAGHEDGDAPESHLFLEDGATITPTRASGASPPASDFPRDDRWIAATPPLGRSHTARPAAQR